MMVAEIVGGLLFGSIALVADGLHMSTHASALLLAALAYRYARRHADDPRFSFGTGKLGDLAGFSSAIVLAMIAILIGYEAVSRLFAPVPISFNEAIPIAVLGLIVNVASVLLLSGGGHDHGHSHSHGHSHDHADAGHDHDEARDLQTSVGPVTLEIFEDGVPPRFRLTSAGNSLRADDVTIETVRGDGARQVFAMTERYGYLEAIGEIPEPHAFTARVLLNRGGEVHTVEFAEHEHAHGTAHRDNNMRAAIIHVLADAVVSVLVIAGLLLGRTFGWLFMDPVAGICRRARDRRMVIRAHTRYRRHPARHESRPQHGGKGTGGHRARRRPARRPASVAPRSRPSRRNPLGRHDQAKGPGLLSTAARPLSLFVARDRRDRNAVIWKDPTR